MPARHGSWLGLGVPLRASTPNPTPATSFPAGSSLGHLLATPRPRSRRFCGPWNGKRRGQLRPRPHEGGTGKLGACSPGRQVSCERSVSGPLRRSPRSGPGPTLPSSRWFTSAQAPRGVFRSLELLPVREYCCACHSQRRQWDLNHKRVRASDRWARDRVVVIGHPQPWTVIAQA